MKLPEVTRSQHCTVVPKLKFTSQKAWYLGLFGARDFNILTGGGQTAQPRQISKAQNFKIKNLKLYYLFNVEVVPKATPDHKSYQCPFLTLRPRIIESIHQRTCARRIQKSKRGKSRNSKVNINRTKILQ